MASTMSSYIPTAGSTVTRAAETLEVAAANMPWPTPVVIGPELVTNGTFDTDTDWAKGTGWTISGGVASAVGAGDYFGQTNIVPSATAALLRVSWDQTITAGTRFRFFPRNATDTAGAVVLSGSATGGASFVLGNCVGSGTFTVYVSTTNGFTFKMMSEVGNEGTVDNISVKEINPLAVSIQMDGTMTGASSTFADWTLDASNGILMQSGASDFTFTQEAGGVVDTVTGGSYTSGVNVDFNLAARHGSTFVNGAVDGVALTANTTPTALPDLSATNFKVAPTFNGNIGKVRVWADDLGDTGIAEGSTP